MGTCCVCNTALEKDQRKYCSNKCQSLDRYHEYIRSWKENQRSGSRGIVTKNISQHLVRYLIEKHGEKCICCGWHSKNPVTGKVPLEIDHIDGNAENNREENLRLICPNCHSLSPNFRNLNKGHGRKWRKVKYLKTNLGTLWYNTRS